MLKGETSNIRRLALGGMYCHPKHRRGGTCLRRLSMNILFLPARYDVIAYPMNQRMLEKGIYNIRRLVFLGGLGGVGEKKDCSRKPAAG